MALRDRVEDFGEVVQDYDHVTVGTKQSYGNTKRARIGVESWNQSAHVELNRNGVRRLRNLLDKWLEETE